MTFVEVFSLCFWSIMLVLTLILVIKNEVTFICMRTIDNAVYDYNIDMLNKGMPSKVSFFDTKSYNATLWCLWDWGYKNILPKDKYEIIKPYIKKWNPFKKEKKK